MSKSKKPPKKPTEPWSENPKAWMHYLFREWVLPLGIAFIVAFFFRTTIASPRHIPTGSMIPTIKIGELIFVNMLAFDLHVPFTRIDWIQFEDPKRGDVIVFEYPEDRDKDYIKRVVGIPGDTIEIRNKEIILNGRPLERKPHSNRKVLEDLDTKYGNLNNLNLFKETNGDKTYTVMTMDERVRPSRNFPPTTVPADSYFVMGDNRDDSHDSRYWGFVPRENLLGRGSFIWFSFDLDHFPILRFSRFFNWIN